jgi:RNA polymerase sigma-70 factor (ECF subfamily)
MAESIEDLYSRFGPMVLRRCRRLLRDEAVARETMHDVFVQLLQGPQYLASENPGAMLHRISTNLCLNKLRGMRRRPEDPEEALLFSIASADDLEARSAAKSLLRRLFGVAPESSGAIAVMHLLDGMTHEEVAQRVGLSVSGVRKRLRMLRAQVQSFTQEVP